MHHIYTTIYSIISVYTHIHHHIYTDDLYRYTYTLLYTYTHIHTQLILPVIVVNLSLIILICFSNIFALSCAVFDNNCSLYKLCCIVYNSLVLSCSLELRSLLYSSKDFILESSIYCV